MSVQFISGLIGFLLTVMVLSYLIGDSLVFRIATYVFVGVSAGYIAAIVIRQVILPFLGQFGLSMPLPTFVLMFIPLLFSVLILMKISPRLSWLGGPAVGYLVGVSAAVAIGGAVLGTLLPQIAASAEPFDVFGSNNQGADLLSSLFVGGLMLVGTITTLAYFHFGARRQPDGSVKRNSIINILAWVGQLFVAVTFGVLFAGVYSAALTALIERIQSLISLFF